MHTSTWKSFGERSNLNSLDSFLELEPGNTVNSLWFTELLSHLDQIRLADSVTRPSKDSLFTESASEEEVVSETSARVASSESPETRVSESKRELELTSQLVKSVLDADALTLEFLTLTGLVKMPLSNSMKSFLLTPTTRLSVETHASIGSPKTSRSTENREVSLQLAEKPEA